MFTRIVVPLDGSVRAERALPVAARVARASAGHLTLVQAVAPPTPMGGLYDPTAISVTWLEQDRTEATAYLDRVSGWPLFSGLTVETRVLVGDPAAVILDTVAEQQADLVVLCSHGRTGAARWMLGSVAEHIARQSPAPVLVLRESSAVLPHAPDDPIRTKRVLVPLDGSPFAEAALEPAAALVLALADHEPAALHLTLALAPYAADPENTPEHLAVQGARAYLMRVADRMRATYPTLTVSWAVALDLDVAEALLSAAGRGTVAEGESTPIHSDVIAMATHGRSGIARWALGSITERVLHTTTLPILVVRPRVEASATSVPAVETQTSLAQLAVPAGDSGLPRTAPLRPH